MPLSAEEQRRLAELEESLSADDPGFARTFSRNAPRPRKKAAGGSGSRRRTVGCSLAIALGVVMLLAGVEKSWIISVIGFVVMLVASLALYGGLGGRRPRAGPPGTRPGPTIPQEAAGSPSPRRWRSAGVAVPTASAENPIPARGPRIMVRGPRSVHPGVLGGTPPGPQPRPLLCHSEAGSQPARRLERGV
ncbi:DUF3040 domain-containing protein [Acidipropionibacterium acidipropionici]|uniref:DUF3040 domain-containing protein n=1 Tax=Acidipropionibacterium acidipropionici TaxID=1748 RepID=UPI001E3BB214|nr:DUF3040 domain-containing protein [Acidipropionibacterium acidipropionici]